MNFQGILRLIDSYNLLAINANIADISTSISQTDVTLRRSEDQNQAAISALNCLLDEQAATNSLLRHSLRAASRHHRELKAVRRLVRMISEKMEAAEATSRRSAAVKELLYSFERYQRPLSASGDWVEKACAARLLLRELKEQALTTKDLPAIDDKRYFDACVEHATALLEASPKAAICELDRFEKAYALFLRITAVDFNEKFRERPIALLEEKTDEEWRDIAREMYGPRRIREIPKDQYSRLASLIIDWYYFLQRNRRLSEGADILELLSANGGFTIPRWKADAVLYFGTDDYEELRAIQAAWLDFEPHVDEHVPSAKTVARFRNDKAMRYNQKLPAKRKQAIEQRNALVGALRGYVNAFIGSHPSIVQFFARVPDAEMPV